MTGGGFAFGRQTRPRFAFRGTRPRHWKAAENAEKTGFGSDIRGAVTRRRVSRRGRVSTLKANWEGRRATRNRGGDANGQADCLAKAAARTRLPRKSSVDGKSV